MRRFLRSAFAVAVLVLPACQDGSQPTAPTPQPSRTSPPDSRYIVALNPDVTDVAAAARDLAARHGGELVFTYRHAFRGFAARLPDGAAEALAASPEVAYVEPDAPVWLVETVAAPSWGLDRIDTRERLLDGFYTYERTGAGVTVYIIDTGIRTTHADFGGRASVGMDAVGDGRNGQDCHGHGTHVAGTVGGTGYGVAKDVSLVAVRVLNCTGSGTITGVMAGIDWVTANAGRPAVANMSLGGGASTSLDASVRNSIAAGISYAIAAGNGNFLGFEDDACAYSPSRVLEAMTVSATTSGDVKASWANYGNCVDWFAPGVDITSAWNGSDTDVRTISGTSMATPHTAGVAALYLEGAPDASPAAVRDALYAATTKGVVTSSRTANNHLLYSLLGAGEPPPPPPGNQPPSAAFDWICADLVCAFADGSTDGDGTVTAWQWSFGDGGGSPEQNPGHTYAAAGTYTVTLTVTDDGGATGSASQQVTVSAPESPYVLTATGTKVKGVKVATLSWTGITTPDVFIVRNFQIIDLVANTGSYVDRIGRGGGGTFTYYVCDTETTLCSNAATVTF
jgi:PKD repeat protein